MRIWIDIDDLFEYAAVNARPSGIQRLAYELCRAMRSACAGQDRIRFVRHDRRRGSFAEVAWEELEGIFAGLTAPPQAPRPARPAGEGIEARLRRLARPLARRLPNALRQPVSRALRAQLAAIAAAVQACRVAVRLAIRALRTPGRGNSGFTDAVRPGDVLFTPGAAYTAPHYPAMIARAQRDHRVRVALLLYDIIPVRRPEYVDRAHAAVFRAWLDAMLPLCDTLLAISRSAAGEVEDHAQRSGLALRGPVHPIPIGTGFSAAPAGGAVRPDLPAPGSYVLFVSTLEARKNHALLFRVWCRLLGDMPEGEVPTLVFAGRIGWLVADLVAQMRNTDFLGGRIRLIEDATDAELTALYRGTLFTVFPSFYEGWGLPVSESLAFGKPCLVSNSTSLPEAGGSLARYFDPDDVLAATALIRAILADRAGLAAWTEQVRTEFRPVPWEATARAVLERLTGAPT